MTKRVWHKGPPPHVGWWNASAARKDDVWRWWNGEFWSFHVTDYAYSYVAGETAKEMSESTVIEWTDYWPENARVPRVKP